ncbi:hypothetical protein [Bdellovibrio sp.]|uniref:hypothetical protein n=1 Tax=Bdellovibrio sp. TaxID=28201 RepID=UPI00322174FF
MQAKNYALANTVLGSPRTTLKGLGSVTFKEEHVREVAESLLMRSILGLVEMGGFTPCTEWVRGRLSWAEVEDVDFALQNLHDFGMLQMGSDGRYISFDINFDDYLSHTDSLSAQYLFSTELGQLIRNNPEIINTQATGTHLWSEDIYHKFVTGLQILITQANKEASMSSDEKDMLVSFNFSMTEVTRPVSSTSTKKGE